MNRILLIKLRYIGDVVLCTPLLPLIRKHFPDAKLTFLVNPGTEGVLCGNPYLDEVMIVPRQGWMKQWAFIRGLRKRGFDVVLDLTDADRSALLSWWSGASVRIGYNREKRWRGTCYTHVRPSTYGSMHMVDYHAQALVPLGIVEAVGLPELFVGEEERQKSERLLVGLPSATQFLVLLHPTARYELKAWPLERFAALADWLVGQGAQVAIIGSQQEWLIGQQIVNVARKKLVNLMGQTPIPELAGLMKRSGLLIANDGGPLHIAAAVGCPAIGLFGPSDPAVWGPRGHTSRVIYKGVDCEECFYPGCSRGEESCMRQISVEEVCQAAQAFLPVSV